LVIALPRALAGSVLLLGAGLVLSASLLFGGATRSGALADVIVQILAILLLLLALARLPIGQWRSALIFCAALVAVPLFQLIPLPPPIWTALPHRDLAVEALTIAGQPLGWRPLSLTPHATWLSFVSLIPPLAIFLATLQLSAPERRWLVALLIGWGLLSSFVGLLQVAQGPDGWLAEFGLYNDGEASGFFANRNHYAALLYSVLVLAAAFVIDRVRTLPVGAEMLREARNFVLVLAGFLTLVILLAGEIVARSRAGIGLTMVALLGIAALVSGEPARAGTRRIFVGAVVLTLVFASQFALYRLLDRFEADPLEDARIAFARNTWDAAVSFLPWGSGLGSFVPVYQAFEPAKDALVDTYVNRAHNDSLEVWLETGLFGLLLMGLFGSWLVLRLTQVWRSRSQSAQSLTDFDRLVMRAASLVLLLLIAHSFVDYPLRTTAMSAVFALCCALLFDPLIRNADNDVAEAVETSWANAYEPGLPDPASVTRFDASSHDEVRAAASTPATWAWPDPTPDPSQPPTHKPGGSPWPVSDDNASETPVGQRWNQDVVWPDAWQERPSKSKSGPNDET
jgi:O-antigen ligase